MSDFELGRHKGAMEVDFKKNVLKPGDAGFEYDKRVDFGPKADAAADWDDEDEIYEEDDYSEFSD